MSEGMKQLLTRRLSDIDVNNLTFRSADSDEIRPAQLIESPIRERWVYHLPDNSQIELVAICRPKKNPRRFWDPGGNIIEGEDFWSQSRTVAFELAVILERPQQSEGENPAPDGKFYSLYGWKKFDPNKPLKVSYATGFGEWQDMGVIKEGQDLGNYNLVEVGEVKKGELKQVRAKMFWKFNPEFGIRLVAVDNKGKEYPMKGSDGFIGNFEAGQRMLYYEAAMGLNKEELSHFILQRRPMAWAVFEGFATKPVKEWRPEQGLAVVNWSVIADSNLGDQIIQSSQEIKGATGDYSAYTLKSAELIRLLAQGTRSGGVICSGDDIDPWRQSETRRAYSDSFSGHISAPEISGGCITGLTGFYALRVNDKAQLDIDLAHISALVFDSYAKGSFNAKLDLEKAKAVVCLGRIRKEKKTRGDHLWIIEVVDKNTLAKPLQLYNVNS
ncbi:MAG: hypothetical protein J7M40_09040 [Planctomycetes bacterium]|nr:hypothetical protein [Planctomycetota bacterium]